MAKRIILSDEEKARRAAEKALFMKVNQFAGKVKRSIAAKSLHVVELELEYLENTPGARWAENGLDLSNTLTGYKQGIASYKTDLEIAQAKRAVAKR